MRWSTNGVFSHVQRTGLPKYAASRCVKMGPSAPLPPSSCRCLWAIAASAPETAAGADETADRALSLTPCASRSAATRRLTSRSLRRAIRPFYVRHSAPAHAGTPPNAAAGLWPSPPTGVRAGANRRAPMHRLPTKVFVRSARGTGNSHADPPSADSGALLRRAR